jgi:hypothetical protein
VSWTPAVKSPTPGTATSSAPGRTQSAHER